MHIINILYMFLQISGLLPASICAVAIVSRPSLNQRESILTAVPF